MNTDTFGRRECIKYGLLSSLFFLSGCSKSQKKLALRGVFNLNGLGGIIRPFVFSLISTLTLYIMSVIVGVGLTIYMLS